MTRREVAVTPIYDRNIRNPAPIIVNVGGARSSKSYSILQLILQKFISEDHKEILIARKTLPSLRITAYKVFVDLLQDYGFYGRCTHNKTNLTIKHKNSTVYFMSIDDPEKIKSTEFNYVFLEEANEFTYTDFMILKMRMSAPTTPDKPNKMYLALNPSEEFSWVNQKLIHWDNVALIKSTYHDNPFLSPEYTQSLEDLKEIDPELYKIYALGEYAALSNIIYPNYVIEQVFPTSFHDEFYGLDFGYNHPAALVRIGAKDAGMYVEEVIYQTHLTNPELIELMDECKVHKKLPIYADSAEPKSIEDLCNAGYNVLPATKQVLDGIKSVKEYKLHIHKDSVNIIKERMTYKWREDKNGNRLDEPVKFNDHACFIAGTTVTTSEGVKSIEEVHVGDKALTRRGFKNVVANGKTGIEKIETMFLEDGTTLTGTPDHPIWVVGKGYIGLDAIRYGDYVWKLKQSNSMESDSTDTPNLNGERSERILDHTRCTSKTASRFFTGKYGKAFMEKSRQGIISTISMAIPSTIRLKISNAYQHRCTYRSTPKNGLNNIENKCSAIWTRYAHSRRSGTLQKKEDSGTESMEKRHTNQEYQSKGYATNAAQSLTTSLEGDLIGSAQTNANQHRGGQVESTSKSEHAKNAEPYSSAINTQRLVAVRVVAVQKYNGKQGVYNLTVEDAHEYFANGILVSNCDATRYGIHTHYNAPKKPPVVTPRGH